MNAELAAAAAQVEQFLRTFSPQHSAACGCPQCSSHALRKSWPLIVAALDATGSEVTESLVAELRTRDAHGKKKYGTSLDREDLTGAEWAQHMKEELLDAAGYLESWKRKAAKEKPCAST